MSGGNGRVIRQRHAYTLIELVVTLPLTTILLAGLASAIHIATQAVPDGTSPASQALSVHAAVVPLLADLRVATSIVSRTSTDITFQVPDRNGDGNAETVRYYWTGTQGTPLLRQLNGNAAEAVASGVGDFTLRYTTRTLVEGGSTVYRLWSVDLFLRMQTSGAEFVAATAVLNQPQVASP